ncbi:hypothetical protein JTB14_000972 [Gonioctena quinquepunctata]|nr:hypothetical protein JTB14_000972 [Gonioctena quinquepunctata]
MNHQMIKPSSHDGNLRIYQPDDILTELQDMISLDTFTSERSVKNILSPAEGNQKYIKIRKILFHQTPEDHSRQTNTNKFINEWKFFVSVEYFINQYFLAFVLSFNIMDPVITTPMIYNVVDMLTYIHHTSPRDTSEEVEIYGKLLIRQCNQCVIRNQNLKYIGLLIRPMDIQTNIVHILFQV